MAHINQTRLTSGPDAGKLRVMIDVRLCAADELALARAFGLADAAAKELGLPSRKRGLGPVADVAVNIMWNALADKIEEGRTAKPNKKRKES